MIAPDTLHYGSFENKYRFARVNLATNKTTYETRSFGCRRDFLEHLATWNRAGLGNPVHGPVWGYYEAPAT